MQAVHRSIALSLALVLSAGPATADPADSPVPDPAAGAAKAAICGGCHGPDGNAPNPAWPKLAGQQGPYLAKQLKDFQAARRSNPMMSAMAAPLSPQDIADVSAHFASLPVQAAAQPGAAGSAGERLYREGRPEDGVLACASCHGLRGEGFTIGVDGGFPAIGSQNGAYLATQLQAFRDGERGNDWQGLMQRMAAGLTDEDIGALAAYLSSLPRGPAGPAAELAAQPAGGG